MRGPGRGRSRTWRRDRWRLAMAGRLGGRGGGARGGLRAFSISLLISWRGVSEDWERMGFHG